jgi:NADH dehydrogenase
MVMVDALRMPSQQLVTVFGGSGFLGRFVVRALVKRGYRVRIATRRPDRAYFLQPLGVVGQIVSMQANLRDDASVARAVDRADAVVNLIGILAESGRQTFDVLQAEGPARIARLAAPHAPIIHVSAIGADENSHSLYARSKARGEANLLAARPDAIVMRPSLLFGNGDGFFNRFAALARMLPVLPLAGAESRFQPVFAGDVAEAIARAVDGQVQGGRVYELGGPKVETLRRLVEYVLKTTGRRRFIAPVPASLARLQGTLLGFVDTATFGLLPREFAMTRDQAIMLESDNVVSQAAIDESRTLQGLGITPMAYEAVVPSYLQRFRKTGQFDSKADAAVPPDTLA